MKSMFLSVVLLVGAADAMACGKGTHARVYRQFMQQEISHARGCVYLLPRATQTVYFTNDCRRVIYQECTNFTKPEIEEVVPNNEQDELPPIPAPDAATIDNL